MCLEANHTEGTRSKSEPYPSPERLLEIADAADKLACVLCDEWYLQGVDAMQNPGQIFWPQKPGSCHSLITDTARLYEAHQRATSAAGAAKGALTDIILEDCPSESEQKRTSLIRLLSIASRTVVGWPHDVLAALRRLSEIFKTVEDALDPRNDSTNLLTISTVGAIKACAMILRREVAKKQGVAEPSKADDASLVTKMRKPSVNARMLETMQKNWDATGWSSRQWAEYLKCAKSTVVATQAWKDVAMRRERGKAERTMTRKRGSGIVDHRKRPH